jgi:hypothetical protein
VSIDSTVFTCRFSLHSPTKESKLKKAHSFLLSSYLAPFRQLGYELSKFYPPHREEKYEELGEVGAAIAGRGWNK